MKLNEDKCHLMIFRANNHGVAINIGAKELSDSESEKLLGVTLDATFNVSHHANQLCMKASQKLYAIARISWKRHEGQNNYINYIN